MHEPVPEASRRARLIKETHPHSCHEELRELGDPYIGSIAECSCGQQYIRKEQQFDGRYWSEHSHEIYRRTPERRG